jgi:hypothetical protein
VLGHWDVLLNRSLSHRVSQENHLEYHIVATLYTEENNTPITWAPSPLTRVHIVSSQTTHPSHGHPPHTGAHNVPFQSQRGTTHPSHGHTQLMGSLTGRLTQSVSWRMSHAAVIINRNNLAKSVKIKINWLNCWL